MSNNNTFENWHVSELDAEGNVSENYIFIEPGVCVIERMFDDQNNDDMKKAHLLAAAPELLKALIQAQEFIDNKRQELHGRRISDWYPEGSNNAALSMSEDMRLLGNACADFDVSAVIAKATGVQQ